MGGVDIHLIREIYPHSFSTPTFYPHKVPRARNMPHAMTSRVPLVVVPRHGLGRRGAWMCAKGASVPLRTNVDHRGTHTVRRAKDDDDDDLFAFLEAQMSEEVETEGGIATTDKSSDAPPEPGSPMDGEELRKLVLKKWGKMYDTRIHQRRDQFNKLGLYLQVMWKFVGQKSFPMTETQYIEQLDAVAELLTEWGAQDEVRSAIPASTKFPRMDTTGANAVSIPLSVEVQDEYNAKNDYE